jgi:hypothetical protein
MASGHVNRIDRAEHIAAPTKPCDVKISLANLESMVWTPPCLRGEIANVNYIEGGLVMQMVRIGLGLAKYVFVGIQQLRS